MDRLNLSLEVKAVDFEQRIIEGHAAVFNNIDQGGDVIEPGAFKDTLANRSPADVLVFIGHDMRQLPVGMPLTSKEDGTGLYTRTKIHQTTAGNDLLQVAKERMDAGRPLGMSIGYIPIEKSFEQRGAIMVRVLKKVDLVEYSYTAIPMNTAALVTAVKQQEEKGAIPSHKTRTDATSTWDGPAAVADAPQDRAVLHYMHAWVDSSADPDLKGSYKFPHHEARMGAPAVINGVNHGLSRLSQANIPSGDDAGVLAHLHGHRRDAGLEQASADLAMADLAVKAQALSEALATEYMAQIALGMDIKAGRAMSAGNLERLHTLASSMLSLHTDLCDLGEKCPLAPTGDSTDASGDGESEGGKSADPDTDAEVKAREELEAYLARLELPR